MTLPLTSIKHALSIVDDWFDSNRSVITALDRLALEEVWNAYYAVAQASQSSPSLVITNLSTLYLETVRLQQFVKDHASSEQPSSSITQLLTQLKQYLEQHGPDMQPIDEAAERIIAGHASHQMTNHSIPSSPTPRQQSLAPTDSVVSAEQLQRLLSGYASSSLSNEQLAHELILDPDFELQKAKPATALEQQIDTIARKAFFDQINDDILGGEYKTSVLPLLQDIKARLLSFVPPTSHGYRLVDDALDLALFEQQMDQGGFDLAKVIRFVLDSMLQMAAPIRDDTIRQIDSVTQQGYQLRSILETLELMTLDLMNFRLKRLRPQLVPVAVDYEHAAFAKAMGLGTVGLAKTRQWLQLALERVVTKRTEKQDGTPLTTNMVVDEAYVGLLTATTAWNRLTCPETVLLDVDRIITYQNDLQEVVIVAALVLLGKNAGLTQVKPFTKKIFALLKDTRQGGGGSTTLDHLASEMERAISTEVSEDKKRWIRSIVAKTLSHSDPVYRLLEQRCASILRHQLATGDFVDPAVLLQSGLEPVQPQLKALCLRIKLFAEHNRRVYASWYHDLVSDLQQ